MGRCRQVWKCRAWCATFRPPASSRPPATLRSRAVTAVSRTAPPRCARGSARTCAWDSGQAAAAAAADAAALCHSPPPQVPKASRVVLIGGCGRGSSVGLGSGDERRCLGHGASQGGGGRSGARARAPPSDRTPAWDHLRPLARAPRPRRQAALDASAKAELNLLAELLGAAAGGGDEMKGFRINLYADDPIFGTSDECAPETRRDGGELGSLPPRLQLLHGHGEDRRGDHDRCQGRLAPPRHGDDGQARMGGGACGGRGCVRPCIQSPPAHTTHATHPHNPRTPPPSQARAARTMTCSP